MKPVALITGGQQGIGLGIAASLSAAGFRLVLDSQRAAPAQAESAAAAHLVGHASTTTADVARAREAGFETPLFQVVRVPGAGLWSAGARATLVANRTFARAEALAARWGGKAVHFEGLADCLARADIVISSTDAPHYVIHRAEVAGQKMTLALGYSHPVVYELPKGVSAKIDKNIITLSSTDREVLGETPDAGRCRVLGRDPTGLVRSVLLFDVYRPPKPSALAGG